MSRGGAKISRVDNEFERAEMPDWLGRFADSLNKSKTAVEVARLRDQKAQEYSILNQISSLVSNKPRHATVESVVEEMKERTGLNSYLGRISSDDSVKKKAEDPTLKIEVVLPESLAKYKNCAEDISNFIINTIDNMHGQGVTIPQIQHDIIHLFGKKFGVLPQDVLNDQVAKYINDCILSSASKYNFTAEHNSNIGVGVGRSEVEDDDSRDAFAVLMPAKG